MQPFDENNIRKAFEKWDNEPATFDYNKSKILNKLGIGTIPLWQQRLTQVAAIAIIILLSGALGYALVNNIQAREDNQLLLSQQIKQQRLMKQLRDSLNNTKTAKETKYVTVIEEKKVPDPECDQNQLQLQHQLATLDKENMSLKASLQQLSTATDELTDSIQKLLTNMDAMEQEYIAVIDKMKEKPGFDINYNQQMIASTSPDKSAQQLKEINEEKVQLKLGSGPNRTAPIRRSFSFR